MEKEVKVISQGQDFFICERFILAIQGLEFVGGRTSYI